MYGRRTKIAILLASATILGCRENALTPAGTTIGYRIEGRVTDYFGTPATGVGVLLFYDYDLVDMAPPPPVECTVVDTLVPVSVGVYESGILRRTLFTGLPPSKTFKVLWNWKDSSGAIMPSGLYVVRYVGPDSVLASYPVIVEGGRVALTDANGDFAIDSTRLPIGFYPVPGYSYDSTYYYGKYEVIDHVYLEFLSGGQTLWRSVILTKGVINSVDVVL